MNFYRLDSSPNERMRNNSSFYFKWDTLKQINRT